MRHADVYPDRHAAGLALVRALRRARLRDPVVLALPRGGVPVGRAVADALHAPLDVLLIRKVGAPGHRELGLGAVGEDGVTVLDQERISALRVPSPVIQEIAEEERIELERRSRRYRALRPPARVRGRDAILVDDGIATGGSAAAAVEVVRQRGARQVIVAVPVAATSGVARLERVADLVVCPRVVDGRFAVGAWYEDFHQLDDAEVLGLLTGIDGSGSRRRASS